MFPIRSYKKITKFYLNVNGVVLDSKSVSTVSSLFQPINLPPKNAKIIKDEPTAKSQKVGYHTRFTSLSD